MKFILINDFAQLIHQKYKYFISFLISAIIFIIYQLLLDTSSESIFLSTVGMEIQDKKIVSLILYLLNKIILLFSIYNIFIYDFKNSMDNLFMRISTKRMIFFKCFSALLFIFVFRTLFFLLVFTILKISNHIPFGLSFLFNISFKDVMYNDFLQLFSVLIIWLCQTKK